MIGLMSGMIVVNRYDLRHLQRVGVRLAMLDRDRCVNYARPHKVKGCFATHLQKVSLQLRQLWDWHTGDAALC